MNLDSVESGYHGTRCRSPEVVNNLRDAVLVKGGDGRPGVLLAIGGCGSWTDRNPAALFGRNHPAMETRPPFLCGGFPAGVAQLDSNRAAKLVDSVSDGAPRCHLGVIPQPGVTRADAAFRADRSGLCDDEAEASHSERSIVDEVPGAGNSVLRIHGILAHRRQPGAVANRQSTKGEGLEQER